MSLVGCAREKETQARPPQKQNPGPARRASELPERSPSQPFLGVPHDQERKIEARESALYGITTMTKVQDSDYATYLELKKKGRLSAEERRGEAIYFAVENTRCVPFRSTGPNEPVSAMVVVTERHRAEVPLK
jgi:hypothetical protein